MTQSSISDLRSDVSSTQVRAFGSVPLHASPAVAYRKTLPAVAFRSPSSVATTERSHCVLREFLVGAFFRIAKLSTIEDSVTCIRDVHTLVASGSRGPKFRVEMR